MAASPQAPRAESARLPNGGASQDMMSYGRGREKDASSAREREYIRFEVVDFHCKALSKVVPARHRDVKVYMYSGALAYGANQEVMLLPDEIAAAGCPNAKLVPDWSTEQVLPWACRPSKNIVVKRVYCEMEGMKLGPRSLCGRMLAELKSFDGKGYELLAGGELEFVMAKCKDGSGEVWEPMFNGPEIFTTLQSCKAIDFCYDLERHMDSVGVDILTMNTEYGKGQLEITFAPKFGIEAPDMTATFRTGTKEMAQDLGLRATFMAKPFGVSGVGNGGHMNFSIWMPGGVRGGDPKDVVSRVTSGKLNAFHSSEDAKGLSPAARSFLAGILAHAPALEALCSPTPPCYCRHGNWAPTVANWGFDDRTACVRVKADRRGPPGSCYMELRMPSAAANPYLVLAGLVASGLDGLQQGMDLPPERQTKADGAAALPASLDEALRAFEADSYLVSKLGQRFVRWYVDVKRAELKFIEERLKGTSSTDEDVSAAWQALYFEFV
ncbi:Lgsn [Symbiodinium sp. CCMP2592]|nr:Lgsn [Symbiodinium sp. CCMP2592]